MADATSEANNSGMLVSRVLKRKGERDEKQEEHFPPKSARM
jgi:hypothetical protein